MTTKANPDYSKSAVHLCNPPEVKALLDQLHNAEDYFDEAVRRYEKAVNANPEVANLWKTVKGFAEAQKQIKEKLESAIKEHGSYQDIEAGHYAVLQSRNKREYDPLPILKAPADSFYGKAKSMVVIETIDVKRLEALVKGGVLIEQTLIDDGVIKLVPMAPAYIIK